MARGPGEPSWIGVSAGLGREAAHGWSVPASSGSLAICARGRRHARSEESPASLRPRPSPTGPQIPRRSPHDAREVGVITTHGEPSDLDALVSASSAEIRPAAATRVDLSGRPVLVLHGADDDIVPVDDARTIAQAVGSSAELRDPRGSGSPAQLGPSCDRAATRLARASEDLILDLLEGLAVVDRDARSTASRSSLAALFGSSASVR